MSVAVLRPPVRPLVPIAVTIGGIALYSIMDALMKRGSIAAGVYTVLLLRCVIGAGLLAPAWWLQGRHVPRWPVMRIHLLRGVIAAGVALAFFWGLVRTPMAEGMALSFIAPLIALWLASVTLGEKIRRAAILAALFGLAGVGVIAFSRLSAPARGDEAALGIVAILFAAVLYAANLVLQRHQAQLAGPLEVTLSQNVIIVLVLLPAAPFLWQTPSPSALYDIAGTAVLASAALMLLSWAYARAEAQVLVPIEYTAFIWAALMGWLWFDEAVTLATLAGLGLIMVGVWLGTRASPQAAAPPG